MQLGFEQISKAATIYREKDLGNRQCILIKLRSVHHGATKHPEQVRVMDLEVAINPSWLGIYLEGPALGSLFPCCNISHHKPGPLLGWGPPGLGAGRENTATTT